MDATQKLICLKLGNLDSYQTVLNSQKRKVTFRPSGEENLQLMHDGTAHWLLTFVANGQVRVCDSLRDYITRNTQKSMKDLYNPFFDSSGKLKVTFMAVEKQNDGYNCGPYAIAFAAEILDGKCPTTSRLAKNSMRAHLISCLEKNELCPFPKIPSTLTTCDIPASKTRIY